MENGPPEDPGGDAVCWLSRVCPDCGLFLEQPLPTVCPRCGATVPAEDAD